MSLQLHRCVVVAGTWKEIAASRVLAVKGGLLPSPAHNTGRNGWLTFMIPISGSGIGHEKADAHKTAIEVWKSRVQKHKDCKDIEWAELVFGREAELEGLVETSAQIKNDKNPIQWAKEPKAPWDKAPPWAKKGKL